MRYLDADWIKIPSRKKGIDGYILKRINYLHEKIKTFLRGKRNVATHYLQGYLALFQYRRKHPMYLSEKVGRSLFYHLNCIKTALGIRIFVAELIFIGLFQFLSNTKVKSAINLISFCFTSLHFAWSILHSKTEFCTLWP